jgi:hypothetical protein
MGSVSVGRAQVSVPSPVIDPGNAAPDFSATSAAKTTLPGSLALADSFSAPTTKTPHVFASPALTTILSAEPASPTPKPKFIYGGRDDYRWQLSLGVAFHRFQSNAFNASAVGIQTTVTYFLNDWFGVEGDVTATFAPTILVNEHVKLATYGGGPKIAWRQKRWEPWVHGIFGGAHEQPQIAGQSRNAYMIKAGGGEDFRWNPRVSFRLEGDYVRTGFFGQSQNDFQLSGSIVFHF